VPGCRPLRGQVCGGERPRRQERRRPVGAGRFQQEDAVGDDRVQMGVAVEPRAEAVEEGDGTESGAGDGGAACSSQRRRSGTGAKAEDSHHLAEPLEPPPLAPARGPPTEWGQLVQAHDDRDVCQASPDDLPAIDIHGL
jgi:hypothetical protein